MKIKLSEGARLPTRANPTDAGLDLYANETVHIPYGRTALVDTGVAIDFSARPNSVALLFQRSSLIKKELTLSNAVGVIDADYRGNVKVALVCRLPGGTIITKGDKIAQLVVMPILQVSPEVFEGTEEEWLAESARGTGGFGSSGT